MLGYPNTCVWKSISRGCNTWTNACSIVHAWVKTIFACSLSTSLYCTFGLQKFEQRNFFLASFGVRDLEDLSVAASSAFYNCDRGCQCKVRLPPIKKPQLQKSQKHLSSHWPENLFIFSHFNETKRSKNKINAWSLFCFCVYC